MLYYIFIKKKNKSESKLDINLDEWHFSMEGKRCYN